MRSATSGGSDSVESRATRVFPTRPPLRFTVMVMHPYSPTAAHAATRWVTVAGAICCAAATERSRKSLNCAVALRPLPVAVLYQTAAGPFGLQVLPPTALA